MKAVILAAGIGRRLEPLTETRPKPMIPIANKPLLEHVVEAVVDAGIEEIVLVVGYKQERIQTYFGDGDKWSINVTYAFQEEQLGTGHAVLQAEPHIDSEFLVLNGDRIVTTKAIEQVVQSRPTSGEARMLVTNVDEPTRYGVTELSGNKVMSIVEKPAPHEVSVDIVNAGVYCFTPGIFEEIRATESAGEMSLTDTLKRLVDRRELSGIRYDGPWLDASYLWDIPRMNGRVLDLNGGFRSNQARISDTASVSQRTAIGNDVRIRSNATVQPGTSLGDNVDIGAGAVVSNSVILEDTTIGAGSVLRDCIVGADASVGVNSTIEGGTTDVIGDHHSAVRFGGVVGDYSELGGGVIVTPGSVIGNDATVDSGSQVTGDVPTNAIVRRG